MLLQKDTSGLVLVDVQEKLTPLVLLSEALLSRCEWIIRLANDLGVPVLGSEQYPRGLGRTVAVLREKIPTDHWVEKVHFSCFREQRFVAEWQRLKKKQVVLIGIETHVCVLQTAFDMKDAGFEVFVVVDAVSSRSDVDKKYGLQRMRESGISLVTAEMVFFEWVGQAGTPEFKALSAAYFRESGEKHAS